MDKLSTRRVILIGGGIHVTVPLLIQFRVESEQMSNLVAKPSNIVLIRIWAPIHECAG